MYLLFTKYYMGDQIKNNEMGGACSTYGKQERCIQGFGRAKLREIHHFEELGVDGRIILKCIFNKWINLAQDRDR